ncbi:hypothetical protein V8E55_011951 [Tylopilus felleus]
MEVYTNSSVAVMQKERSKYKELTSLNQVNDPNHKAVCEWAAILVKKDSNIITQELRYLFCQSRVKYFAQVLYQELWEDRVPSLASTAMLSVSAARNVQLARLMKLQVNAILSQNDFEVLETDLNVYLNVNLRLGSFVSHVSQAIAKTSSMGAYHFNPHIRPLQQRPPWFPPKGKSSVRSNFLGGGGVEQWMGGAKGCLDVWVVVALGIHQIRYGVGCLGTGNGSDDVEDHRVLGVPSVTIAEAPGVAEGVSPITGLSFWCGVVWDEDGLVLSITHGDCHWSVIKKKLVHLPGRRCLSDPVIPAINELFMDGLKVDNVKVDVPERLAMPVTDDHHGEVNEMHVVEDADKKHDKHEGMLHGHGKICCRALKEMEVTGLYLVLVEYIIHREIERDIHSIIEYDMITIIVIVDVSPTSHLNSESGSPEPVGPALKDCSPDRDLVIVTATANCLKWHIRHHSQVSCKFEQWCWVCEHDLSSASSHPCWTIMWDWMWIVTHALEKALPDSQGQGLICAGMLGDWGSFTIGLFGMFLRWNELPRYLLLGMDYFTASAASQTFMSSSFLAVSLVISAIFPQLALQANLAHCSVALRHPCHIINLCHNV